MSDSVTASITIGGTLSASLLQSFVEIIQAEGLAIAGDSRGFSPGNLRDGERLTLIAEDVPGGIFGALEAFCTAHALPFSRQSGAQRVVFPGFGIPLSFDLDAAGDVVIAAEIVDRWGIWEAIIAQYEIAVLPIPPLMVVPCTHEKHAHRGEVI